MSAASLSDEIMMAEYLRRERSRESLIEFARSIEIPGAPAPGETWDDAIGSTAGEAAATAYMSAVAWAPVETKIVRHHYVMLEAIQRCMETPNGRLMILAPPGSAKSTYVSVVAPAWAVGKWPGIRLIMTSYATKLARKHSRRCQQIIRQAGYRSIWGNDPRFPTKRPSAEEWYLTNGSEYMAAGILAGITGNRAHGVLADDLIAGRQEADSVATRESTMEAWRDDLESRLLPHGWMILINTHWHEEDPSGQILPDKYDGRSGPVLCRDGRDWHVLNIPAKAERDDDPVGRQVGEYLWPEWFPASHWQAFENDPLGRRRWASLYQQRPTSSSGDDFDLADFRFYETADLPGALRIYGASDYAVTERDPEKEAIGAVDFTEHGVIGFDKRGDIWFLDWWSGQKETDVSIEAWINLVAQHRPIKWWHEGGVIDKAISPALRRAMREKKTYVTMRALPRIADKRAKAQSFAARVGARTVHFPANCTWANDVIEQLTGFPGHRFDDKYDVCGLIGRGIDAMLDAKEIDVDTDPQLTPMTDRWIGWSDDEPEVRYR